MTFAILAGLVFWLLPIILTGNLAAKQGRNVALWVVVAIFFGWIPCIVLLALSGT